MKITLAVIASIVLGFGAGYFTARSQQEAPPRADQSVTEELPRAVAPRVAAGGAGQDGKLSKADADIARLREKNELLAAQIARMNLPVAAVTTYPDLLERIEKVPSAVIKDQLGYVFDEKSLENITDVRAFSRRLVDVLLENDDGGDDTNPATASIYFSTSPLSGSRMLGADAVVAEHDTIFAHIVADGQLGEVIVKWQRLSTGEVLLLENYSFHGTDAARFVSLRPGDGWDAGQYRVDVLAMNDRVTPLGRGSYNLVGVLASESGEDNLAGPNRNVIQDLLQTGQATPKIGR